jgi:hypothetical protein
VVNCTVNGTKRWRGGPDDKVLMLNSGISTDKAKYSTSIEKNGFILTILNLTVEYLNVSYDCSCGLDNDKHILYIDVYTGKCRLVILLSPFGFIAPKNLNYLAFKSFDFEHT